MPEATAVEPLARRQHLFVRRCFYLTTTTTATPTSLVLVLAAGASRTACLRSFYSSWKQYRGSAVSSFFSSFIFIYLFFLFPLLFLTVPCQAPLVGCVMKGIPLACFRVIKIPNSFFIVSYARPESSSSPNSFFSLLLQEATSSTRSRRTVRKRAALGSSEPSQHMHRPRVERSATGGRKFRSQPL